MMRRRVGRPGLIGTMARTAVVAGTATATVGAVSSHKQKKAQAAADQQATQQAAAESQQELAEMQSQLDAMKAQQAAPPPPPPPAAPAGTDDLMDQLSKLADLKAAGVLDDAEFAAAKAKLLGT
jgi:type IV secretory pathway VirB10-like protein